MTNRLRRSLTARRSSRLTLIVVLFAFFVSDIPPVSVHAADGDLDSTFGNGGKVTTDFGHGEDVSAVLVQNDGKIVAVGSSIFLGLSLARYNANGTLDPTFGVAGKVTTNISASANAAVLQADGKIVVGGTSFKVTHYVFTLARYNVDGSLDPSFGSGGIVDNDLFADDQISAISVHQDGKILAVGISLTNGISGVVLAQYNPDGSLDTGFGMGGKVFVNINLSGIGGVRLACAFQPDSKVVLGGFIPTGSLNLDFAVLRVNADGSIDMNFGTNGLVTTDFSQTDDALYALTLQSDGKIVAAGRVATINPSSSHSGLARYNSNGTLDNSFGTGGKVITALHPSFDEVKAVAVQKDGKIVVAGHSLDGLLVARYRVDGTLDQTFGIGGVRTAPVGDLFLGEARNLAIQSDGKIIAAGLAFTFKTDLDFALVRLNGATFDVCIQDESNGNLLQISLATGAYQFTNCSGVTVGGTASVVARGCYVTVQANGPDRRLLARIDTCAHTGTASIQIFSQGTFTLIDRNTANNTCLCKR